MKLNIACIKGDGIGPEIVTQAQKVLNRVAQCYGHEIVYTDVLMGGASIDACGVPLTDEAIEAAKASDAVLMGSIGGNTTTSPWYKLAPELRPEAGLLKLRKSLNLFANLRPALLYPELLNHPQSMKLSNLQETSLMSPNMRDDSSWKPPHPDYKHERANNIW